MIKEINYPDLVTIEGTYKILNQMKNCITKIYNGNNGTGFFSHGIRITKELKINNTKNTQIDNNNKIDNKLDNITERKKIDLIKKNSINIYNKMRIINQKK